MKSYFESDVKYKTIGEVTKELGLVDTGLHDIAHAPTSCREEASCPTSFTGIRACVGYTTSIAWCKICDCSNVALLTTLYCFGIGINSE